MSMKTATVDYGYNFCQALERRVSENIMIVEDDNCYCVELADAIIGYYRARRQLAIDHSIVYHRC